MSNAAVTPVVWLDAPSEEALAAANRVLAALFAGGLLSAHVAFFPAGGAQRRYWAAIIARHTEQGVTEDPRPRRLPVHPARTFGCAGGGPSADPKMPLLALDRLWVLALRNWLDGAPPSTLGLRLPHEALDWLRTHPAALSKGATLTLDD
ncbi:MAG: hypothetical protein NTZ05_05745, partial [Chloroflexi bacterium]|nr:hypothetical protein [Chloroflexota bacterium]